MTKTHQPHRFKTISSFHQFINLPKPEHPLISIIDVGTVKHLHPDEPKSMVFDFYSIALKRTFNAKVKYGQGNYDFDDGIMSFLSPGQVLSIELVKDAEIKQSGWLLLIHPDFLWNFQLAKKIRQYDFFDYSVNEALFLSEKEEAIIAGIIWQIDQEYHSAIDKLSQDIIIAQIEVLLAYAERYYQRQFITRKKINHQILTRLEDLLNSYFESDELVRSGLPMVGYIANQLNISSGYLSGLLRALTGLNAQQHIHLKLIEKAKEKLSTTDLSVSEIAYKLGFEHIGSFSKLFKANLSPLAFRQTFN